MALGLGKGQSSFDDHLGHVPVFLCMILRFTESKCVRVGLCCPDYSGLSSF